MNYRRNETKKKRIKIALAVLVAVAAVFFQEHVFKFSSGITAKAEPVLKLSNDLENKAESGFLAAFRFKHSLLKENEFLKSRISEIEAKLLDHEMVLKENEELRAMLGRGGVKKTILAVVTGKPNHSPYDTLILDVGEKDGIKKGQKVIAYASAVVGEIEEVSETTSRAVLFSSYGKEHEVILSNGNIPIKLTGRGGGNFFSELPRGLSVTKGDQAVLPNLSSKVLGVVEGVFSDPRDPYQKIVFRSPVNQNELRFVEIEL